MTAEILEGITAIVGGANIGVDEVTLAAYGIDATRIKGFPAMVVRPGSEDEVAAIMRLASRYEMPVIPRGAGTGLTGGAVAPTGGIMMSFERMDKILSISAGTRTATVQPGVTTGKLQEEAERVGLFYPPDPGSLAYCTIGGNVAENAGGMRAVKYGVTRDYVVALRAVLPSGEIVRSGAKTAKGVVGYDLTRLLVGSEGTLALVTEITVKLIPKPAHVVTMSAFFADISEAGRAIAAIMASPVTPRCIEFLDADALAASSEKAGIELPEGAGAFLLIETDGSTRQAGEDADAIRALVEPGAISFRTASGPAEFATLWKLRKTLSQAMYTYGPDKLNEDIVVPVDKVADALAGIKDIADTHRLRIVCFGHAGDGNIHTNVMTDKKDPEKFLRAEEAVEEVFRLVLRLGGTLSGEHGVGMTKQAYIGMELNGEEVALMKRVKAAFDPLGLLNPGKIF
ncbi:MAG TPA: FAD-linked oxidase C-terminal domain-containing protein [Nitrospirota bacterium]